MTEQWTLANIPDLSGKIAIVTGANSGIGFEAAKAFVQQGAKTVLACRNHDRAQAALTAIQQESPQAAAEIMLLDLSSLESVRTFARQFQAAYDRLDILLNNAGVMWLPYGKTLDGFEQQFGINHLGHFALTGLLLPILLATPNARIVTVSSMTHQSGKMDFDNLMCRDGKGYSSTAAYSCSKLANLLFAYELQRRLQGSGVDVISLAAHPGIANTNLSHHLPSWQRVIMGLSLKAFSHSVPQAALPSIRAAVDPTAKGGEYYGPNGFMQMTGMPVVVQSNAASHNQADAQRLWTVSEALTDVHYDAL